MTSAALQHLKSLDSIRQRSQLVFNSPQHWQHFDYHPENLPACIDLIIQLINRDYQQKPIPMHSRWRHFDINDDLNDLVSGWKESLSLKEIVQNLLDLFVVSVLLDAGAGDKYRYNNIGRSEGLALASLDMFKSGLFSSCTSNKYQCDAKGLQTLTLEGLRLGMNVTDDNPLVGLQGRLELLVRLGKTIEKQAKYFGHNNPRIGNMLDYLLDNASINGQEYVVDIDVLWDVVVVGLNDVWPQTRTRFENESIGDVWPLQALSKITQNLQQKPSFLFKGTENLVCFHKLSQWLTYSLMEPLELFGLKFKGAEKMTGLAEYRNGGLFIDLKVLTPKHPSPTTPSYNVDDDLIIEWRCLTISLLDVVGKMVRERLGMSEQELPLVKVLEAGTWKAGREVAAKMRPEGKGPPIIINSDGTVF